MGRLPLVSSADTDADPSARDALRAVIGGAGIEPNVYRAIANHPPLLRAMADFARVAYVRNSLSPVQRELAYLTASVTNDCHY
jgi:alkylhydroperoxidase family enzyme